MIVKAATSILLGLGLAGFAGNAPPTEAPAESQAQSESPLLGVRFFASEQNLARIERLAADAGWTQVRRDVPGSILVLAPQPYRFELFEALMEAILPSRLPDAIQLIGRDGRPMGNEEPVS